MAEWLKALLSKSSISETVSRVRISPSPPYRITYNKVIRLTNALLIMYNMTMSVTLSTKYQIVIPKDVRKQLGLKSGQKMEINKIDENSIVLTKQLTADQYIEKYSGLLKNTPWITKKIDAAEYLRNERDRDR